MRAIGPLLLVVASCYAPSPQVGLPCSPTGACPAGQECAPDRTCQLPGGGGDAGDPADGGTPGAPDAAPIPLETWMVSLQNTSLVRASDVARVGGGFALTGSRSIVVLDPRGEIRWQRSLGASASAVTGVPGGMVVAGSGSPGMAAIALDHDGAIRWQKSYRDQESAAATAVVAMPGTDEVVLIGNSIDAGSQSSPWLVRVDGAGEIVWQRRFTLAGGVRVTGGTATSDGGVVAVGVKNGATLEERDLIVFKVGGSGAVLWQQRISGGDNEWGTTAAEGSGGELVLVGGTWSNSFGAADLWLLRLDRDGAIVSQHRIGTTTQDAGVQVFPTGPGGAIVVGETQEAGNGDFYVAEVKDNAIASQIRLGSAQSDYGAGAAYLGGGLVLFGDTPAFGDQIGLFAASVRLPDGLSGCQHSNPAGAQMAASSATASEVTFAVTTTTAEAIDLEAEATAASFELTVECE